MSHLSKDSNLNIDFLTFILRLGGLESNIEQHIISMAVMRKQRGSEWAGSSLDRLHG